jgi:hypothetical protein
LLGVAQCVFEGGARSLDCSLRIARMVLTLSIGVRVVTRNGAQ